MKKVRVALVSLGHQSSTLDFRYIKKWKSEIFEIVDRNEIRSLDDAKGFNWEYPDAQLQQVVRPVPGCDVTIGLCSAPLEDNYYSRRLDNNVVALSIFQIQGILQGNNLRIENFVLRNIYQYSVYFHAFGCRVPSRAEASWSHQDIRGCLFDLNATKVDIIKSMHKPNLCEDCQGRIKKLQIDAGFVPTITRELSCIRRDLFYILSDWVIQHPIWSIAFTGAFGIFLNVLASVIFEKLKRILPLIG